MERGSRGGGEGEKEDGKMKERMEVEGRIGGGKEVVGIEGGRI